MKSKLHPTSRTKWPDVAILATCFTLIISLVYFPPRNISQHLLQVFDELTADEARYAAGSARIRKDGSPIVVIEFDEQSMMRFGASPREPTVPQDSLASLLNVLRSQPNARPSVVFLDIAILDSAIAGDPKTIALTNALRDWSQDLNAPLLGILPGKSCNGTSRLPRDVFPMITTPDGTGSNASDTNLIWACPMFEVSELTQENWACVQTIENSADGSAPNMVALPSASWLGAEARQRLRQGKGPAILTERLLNASRICKRDLSIELPRVAELPMLRGGAETLKKTRIGAEMLVTQISAASVLSSNYDPGINQDAIVVIGSNHYFSDFAVVGDETLPGSYVVGLALRDAFNGSDELVLSRWAESAIAIVIVISIYVLAVTLRGLRLNAPRQIHGWRRVARFVFLQEQIWIVLALFFLFLALRLSTYYLAFPIALGVIFGELSIYLKERQIEWHETN